MHTITILLALNLLIDNNNYQIIKYFYRNKILTFTSFLINSNKTNVCTLESWCKFKPISSIFFSIAIIHVFWNVYGLVKLRFLNTIYFCWLSLSEGQFNQRACWNKCLSTQTAWPIWSRFICSLDGDQTPSSPGFTLLSFKSLCLCIPPPSAVHVKI